MLSLKTKELSSARDVIRSVCREIRLSFSRTWLIHTKRYNNLSFEPRRGDPLKTGLHAARDLCFQVLEQGVGEGHPHIHASERQRLNDVDECQARIELARQMDRIIQGLIGVLAKIEGHEKTRSGHHGVLSP